MIKLQKTKIKRSKNAPFAKKKGIWRKIASRKRKKQRKRKNRRKNPDTIMMFHEKMTSATMSQSATSNKNKIVWFIDSGATSSGTPFRTDFAELDTAFRCNIGTASTPIKAMGKGKVKMTIKDANNKNCSIILEDVLWVPEMGSQRLFSVTKSRKRGNRILFETFGCVIHTNTGRKILAREENDSFFLDGYLPSNEYKEFKETKLNQRGRKRVNPKRQKETSSQSMSWTSSIKDSDTYLDKRLNKWSVTM